VKEARLGFLGMIENAIDLQDGSLADIGGGNAEITLFLNRKLVEECFFPFWLPLILLKVYSERRNK